MNRRTFIHIFTIFVTCLISPIKSSAGNESIISSKIKAPAFNLYGFDYKSNKIKQYSYEEFRNSWLVIYFYPEDFTEGCTIEANGFSKLKNEFSNKNANILGISSDNIDKHSNFCGKNQLTFPLLSDPQGTISKQYHSWSGSNSSRNTFLINPSGYIESKWISVSPIHHAEEVLNTLISLTT
ncbi:peroxiredoxin [Prochlorococcus sp. MIT 1223]|uniref:peroxiredoxin n=1 Tax=Prochlorococcus sp. MIT 1223 TaxID=3096217 RepID=UPI002A7651F3|nr:peroxiredoxin [Prochlorococcus sp. MIT 1223]